MATRHSGDVDLEPLTPIDLDDAEAGIRPEDRYAAIPPGPKLIRRRVHDQSSWAPAWLLAGIVALFVVGALLGRGARDAEGGRDAPVATPPPLRAVTGEKVLLIGRTGIATYHIDDRTVSPVRAEGFVGPVTAAADTNVGLVAVSRERAFLFDDDQAIDLGPAVDVTGNDARGWIVSPADPGLLAAHVVLGPRFAPAAAVLPAGTVRVAATGKRLVVERVAADGSNTIEILAPQRPGWSRRISRGHVLLGSGTSTVASRGDCDPVRCAVVLENVRTRHVRVLADALPADARTTVLSPDGDWLFLQAGHRIEAVDTDTGERFSVGELPDEYATLAD